MKYKILQKIKQTLKKALNNNIALKINNIFFHYLLYRMDQTKLFRISIKFKEKKSI